MTEQLALDFTAQRAIEAQEERASQRAGVCWECGAVGPVHGHHVVPKCRGGSKTMDLCILCHAKVHADTDEVALRWSNLQASVAKPGRPSFGYVVVKRGGVREVVEHRGEQEIIELALEMNSNGALPPEIVVECDRRCMVTRRGVGVSASTIREIVGHVGHRVRSASRPAWDDYSLAQLFRGTADDVAERIGRTCSSVESKRHEVARRDARKRVRRSAATTMPTDKLQEG